jgi:hypothetical protein
MLPYGVEAIARYRGRLTIGDAWAIGNNFWVWTPFRLRIQNFNLICPYNVDFRLALIKLDRAGDTDGFPWERG